MLEHTRPNLRVLHPLPDGRLGFRGDLLADDVVNDGRKKVGIYGAVDVADLVNDRAEPLVLPAQIGNFRFPICKVHVSHFLKYHDTADCVEKLSKIF